jgi:hypothetical protein
MLRAIRGARSSGNGLVSTKSVISTLSSTFAYQIRGAIPAAAAILIQANWRVGSLIASNRDTFRRNLDFAAHSSDLVWPAGTPHRWWNAGTTELRMSGWCRPPDNIEFFLGALFASAKQNGGGRPAPFDATFLITRYRSEYAMLELPGFVRRVLIPILYVVGRVLLEAAFLLRRRAGRLNGRCDAQAKNAVALSDVTERRKQLST